MEEKRPLQSIPDDELLHRLADLMCQSRRGEADIVAHIAEVEERRLYAREAFPSMFVYCMDVLHLSEAEAYLRIWAGRAARQHPMLLTMLADGRLHLTAIVKLAPHLTRENRDGLLERATHLSKRQIVQLVAEITPSPDVPVVVRKLPERKALPVADPLVVSSHGVGRMLGLGRDPTLEQRPDAVAATESWSRRDEAVVSQQPVQEHAPAVARDASEVRASRSASAAPMSAAVVKPLSPGRYRVQFTASSELHDKLERLRALMGSSVPDGDLAAIIEQAITEKLERLEARRFAVTKAPRKGLPEAETERDSSPSSRYVPAAVRRAVSKRDGGRCRFVDAQGRRCTERDRLEFHHRRPFGLGGGHSVANIGLMCRAHNAYLAECDFGREAMARHRRAPNRTSPAPAG